MSKLSQRKTYELLWMAAVIQEDIEAHNSGGEVQHSQYSLEDCYEQIGKIRAELERRGLVQEDDPLHQSVSEMVKESLNELAKESNHDDA